MKTLDRIPTSKIQRASKLVSTGVKIGINQVIYYGDRILNNEQDAKERLNENNAEDIYDSLKSLKGSALKVAQMLSMEKNILPQAYVEKFSLSQFSVPPLSPPLVVKTFKNYFNQHPRDVFDSFNTNSVNAASIGQVHIGEKDGKQLAIKIQYPGVADSIKSDLALVKPIAMKMFNIKGKDSDKYFKEVENKLIEETDYNLEIEQSKYISEACAHIPNLKFPKYYKIWSSDRILTMDYMKGKHLSEFCASNANEELAQRIGQTLWDFYMYQIHNIKKVHADPHPGNFLVSDNAELIALDFGCMKHIPDAFYAPYFELAKKENLNDSEFFEHTLHKLEILLPSDSAQEKTFFTALFHEMLSLFTKPFHEEIFDFSDERFFNDIAALSQKYAKSSELRSMNGNRGSKHFIYMNRTFFGLYNLMFDLKAKGIKISNFKKL
ncbi:MAG: AarF/ABC1/UbiB kinase family protein [Flavobacteriaceae bacterium]|nr:AarF/ABC1/UbiB kinase family protein [Flavobacteriaceae bacterium]